MKELNYFYVLLLSLFVTSCAPFYKYGVASYQLQTLDNKGVVTNNEMSVNYDGNFIAAYTPEGGLLVSNLSDSTLFIDMGESYALDRQGQATRLFTNAVTSQYSSGTTGASVNLGAVANAFGIKGGLGSLANGINVGGSSTNGTTVQTFEERYISVPSHTSRQIKFTNITPPELKAKKNKPVQYDISNSPVAVGNYLSYTYNPEGKEWKSVRNFMHVNEMVYAKNNKQADSFIGTDKSKQKVRKVNPGWWASYAGWMVAYIVALSVVLTSSM